MSESPRQLSGEERKQLKATLRTKVGLPSKTLGYSVPKGPMTQGALVTMMPNSLDDASVSVCGVKGPIVQRVQEFTRPDGTTAIVRCTALALMEILNSPVHVHGSTEEMYFILKGRGQMVLDDAIEHVREGTVIHIPPGVEHGLYSDDDPQTPVTAVLSFSPPIAPKEHPEFRDEALLYEETSTRIAQLRDDMQAAEQRAE